MADFRLEVFYTVVKRLSFTKAAVELFISQPAVSKHIHELEEQYQNKLFERNGNRIRLTPAGDLLFKYTAQLFAIYRTIDFEMNTMANRKQGLLHLGASTTIAHYVIAPVLASFRHKFPDIQISLLSGNTEQVEKALINKEIEFGIVEGKSKHQEISYTEFGKDELVLVCGKNHVFANRTEISPEMLKTIPFVFREQGSGTLEVIDYALRAVDLKIADLPVEIHLGSTESIKEYLVHSSCMAFVSIHALAKELHSGQLRVVDVKGLRVNRSFYFIHLQGKIDGIAEIFLRFTQRFHHLK